MAYAQEKKSLRLVVESTGKPERRNCSQCEMMERLELLRLQLRKALIIASPPEPDKDTGDGL
jgi:hypothetical protein